MHDVVIKGGTIVDGTGTSRYQADLAVDDGKIAEIGHVTESGREEVDASGLLVTPGFVDIHTHYDAQVTWDPSLSSSCWHGITSVVMGNCGVGFAPVREADRDWVIALMEGVEDIPGAVLVEGIRWGWETFPEFLDYVDGLPKALDVGCQIAHGPVRTYAMGERGAKNEPASADDIVRMQAIVHEALVAGAMGFSSSRTILHQSSLGGAVPGTFAANDEIFGIGEAMGRAGSGVFEVSPAATFGEGEDPEGTVVSELDWMEQLARIARRPVVFSLLQNNSYPERWQYSMQRVAAARAEGLPLHPMTSGRPVNALLGLRMPGTDFSPFSYLNPFRFRPTVVELLGRPFAEQIATLRRPEVKERVLAEEPSYPFAHLAAAFSFGLDNVYPLGDDVNYEPGAEDSVEARARRAGRDPIEFFYDAALEHNGEALFLVPLANYSYGSSDVNMAMLSNDDVVLGLSDGGAHCQNLCDSSATTYLLSYWARDRERGPRVPIEWAVRKMSAQPAHMWGMTDRGLLRAGMKADINVIDFDRLRLARPRFVNDLPGGGGRIVQTAAGYIATYNSGVAIVRDGRITGDQPGQLIRNSACHA